MTMSAADVDRALPTVRAVRPATLEDAPVVLEMALAFLQSPAYAGRVRANPAQLLTTILWVIRDQGAFVAETDEGLVGGIGVAVIVSPLTGELVGAEAMWWLDPVYRRGRTALRLWDQAESWARAKGAVLMHMIAPTGSPEVGEMYARRGYVPLETVWQKRLAEEGEPPWVGP